MCWEQYFRCSCGTRTRITTMPCTQVRLARQHRDHDLTCNILRQSVIPRGDYLCATCRLARRRGPNRRNVSVLFSPLVAWLNPRRYFEGLSARTESTSVEASREKIYAEADGPESWTGASLSQGERAGQRDRAAGTSKSPTQPSTPTPLVSRTSSSRKEPPQPQTHAGDTASDSITRSETPFATSPSIPLRSTNPLCPTRKYPPHYAKPSTLPSVFADAEGFHEIFTSLVTEARESGKDKTELHIKIPRYSKGADEDEASSQQMELRVSARSLSTSPPTSPIKSPNRESCARQKACWKDEEELARFDGEVWEVLRGKGKGGEAWA